MENMRTFNKTKVFLQLAAGIFGLYAFITIIESMDFLELLHSKPPDYSPTYTMVNVAYYMMESIICVALALSYWFLSEHVKQRNEMLGLLLFFFLFRIGVVYYLYLYTEEEYRWVPLIYKKASFISELRIVIVPLQLIFGSLAAYWWYQHANKKTIPKDVQ